MTRTSLTLVALALAACRTPAGPGAPAQPGGDTAGPLAPSHDTWNPPMGDTGGEDTGEALEDDTGGTDAQSAALQARPDAVAGVSQVAWVGGGGSLDGWACDGLIVWASRDHECGDALSLPAQLPPDAWLCADVVEAGAWGCIATLDGVAQVVTVRGL